ncbi:MAG: hypothetical protein WAX89_05995 [Alphaproteobacteria bacterium]
MQNLHNHPHMWQVDSMRELFDCLTYDPEAALVMLLESPAMSMMDWQGFEDSLAQLPAQACNGMHQNATAPRLKMERPADAPKQMAAELAAYGIHAGVHPLWDVVARDFGTAYQLGVDYFGSQLVWRDKLRGMFMSITPNAAAHTTHNGHSHLGEFHADLPDWRMVCCYVGTRNTEYIAREDVEHWYQDMSTDFPIWLALPKFMAKVHEAPLRALILHRGGPTPGRVPVYKPAGYTAPQHLYLPHRAPAVTKGARVLFGANFYLNT